MRAKIGPDLGQVTETGRGVRLVLRTDRLDWAAAVLAWLGCPFEIEHPAALRAEVHRLRRAPRGPRRTAGLVGFAPIEEVRDV